jgi:NAD(P)-dependent dehydrogenase (short-subunit alcohol dehydrogenase family)
VVFQWDTGSCGPARKVYRLTDGGWARLGFREEDIGQRLVRYLAKELGHRKITVNTIAPGAIETDFGGGVVRDNPGVNQFIASQTALGRAGLADDIGGALAALLADGAGWINGQRIEVSGGMFL